MVADGSGEGVFGVEGGLEAGERRVDDVAADEGAGRFETAIEIEGGDDGFECIGEDGGLLTATAEVFAAAEAKEGAEADVRCDSA